MTLQLDLRPELEAELTRRATLSGRRLETYATSILEEAVHLPSSSARPDRKLTGTGADLIAIMQRMPYKDEINIEPERFPMRVREIEL